MALANAGGAGLWGSWSADGTIVLSQQSCRLWRVAATGGEQTALIELDPPRQLALCRPEFLPDGRQFLTYAPGMTDEAGVYLGSLDGGALTRLTAADSAAVFLAPDRALYVLAGTLVSRRLDLRGGALTGDPVTLADRVSVEGTAGGFAASVAGLVAYRTGGDRLQQLTWRDRSGTTVGVAGEPTRGGCGFPNCRLMVAGLRPILQCTAIPISGCLSFFAAV